MSNNSEPYYPDGEHLKIDVLDHGYVQHIESWGHGTTQESEAGIIEAARQSTQGSFRGWDTDAKLLGFLFNNKPQHATPFEFAGMVIEVRAPIMVFRELVRHRVFSINEQSARYAALPDLYYRPTFERVMGDPATKNKQAQAVGGAAISEEKAKEFCSDLDNLYKIIENFYQESLANGVPKEIARCIMPVGHYSQMRVSANLRNWLGFLTLRLDPNAQLEIRLIANAIAYIVRIEFPHVYALFDSARSAKQ